MAGFGCTTVAGCGGLCTVPPNAGLDCTTVAGCGGSLFSCTRCTVAGCGTFGCATVAGCGGRALGLWPPCPSCFPSLTRAPLSPSATLTVRAATRPTSRPRPAPVAEGSSVRRGGGLSAIHNFVYHRGGVWQREQITGVAYG